MYRYSERRRVVLPVRILRAILTTFSSTVMLAALADQVSGAELSAAMSRMGAAVGAAIVTTPLLETLILQRTKRTEAVYLALSALGALHLLFAALAVPETLRNTQRKAWKAVLQRLGEGGKPKKGQNVRRIYIYI